MTLKHGSNRASSQCGKNPRIPSSYVIHPPQKRLLASVNKFYPNLTVLVADDTPDEIYETIDTDEFPNVKQYKMPAHKGWFAGRALVISQVDTEAGLAKC